MMVMCSSRTGACGGVSAAANGAVMAVSVDTLRILEPGNLNRGVQKIAVRKLIDAAIPTVEEFVHGLPGGIREALDHHVAGFMDIQIQSLQDGNFVTLDVETQQVDL